ncbi:hypothetical protein [Gramella sp. AN32]|uniref:Uncharacterized protein n=1 Tax=Christiangramia antarctica TaxID=2058158 RepID=A0ABW5X8X8_9FLAO|nr:hypothetical protein [Gramella sp. AN32]MCM4155949.1 hypothetical protein [Gramella sp. AN32]
MKNSLLTSVTLIVIFFLNNSFKVASDNYFQIGSKNWKLESAEITNESYDNKSKFEIDFISGTSKLSDAQTFIYISLTSANTYKVADGIYTISKKSLSDREPYRFNGSIFINNKEVKIVDGTFSVEMNESFSVHMIFKLANGDILNGNYNGKYSSFDRSKNYN